MYCLRNDHDGSYESFHAQTPTTPDWSDSSRNQQGVEGEVSVRNIWEGPKVLDAATGALIDINIRSKALKLSRQCNLED